METKSVRVMVQEHQDKILNKIDQIPPAELEKIGLELSVLMSNISDEVAKLEVECVKFKRDTVMKHENIKMSNALAETLMQAEPVYLEFKKTKGLFNSVENTIQMLKYRLRRLEREYKLN